MFSLLLSICTLYSYVFIYIYIRKHLRCLLILLIYSFGPTGRLVKLTMCAKVCHVDERMAILLTGQTEFKIPQPRTRPINCSTWMRFAAISKLIATSTFIKQSLSFCFVLFNVMPRLAQSS